MTRIMHNSDIVELAKKLRKNMTKEESALWYKFLRNLSVHFVRQKVIGRYIVDFYCASAHLVIELDGSQHYEDNGIENDKKRDEFLYSLGLTVVRYSNLDINKNFEGVCQDILLRLNNLLNL